MKSWNNWIIALLITLITTQRVYSQDICQNTWITRAGFNVLLGSYDPKAKTIQACKSSCLLYPDSVGFDFDGQNRCWITFTGNRIKNANPTESQFVIHYDLLRGVPSCPGNCESGNVTRWNALTDMHVRGGTGTADQTMVDCLKSCFSSKTCVGFDFDEKTSSVNKCYLSLSSVSDPEGASGVTHYERQCVPDGSRFVTPKFILPNNPRLSSPMNTVSTPVTTQKSQVPNRDADNASYLYIKGQAIKPAYIVLAGLGAGCILLVIIAVVVLCTYPLRGDRETSYHEKKPKKQKKHKNQQGELHTRRPKTLTEEEHIGMSTVTTAVHNHDTYGGNSYTNKNGTVKNGTLKKTMDSHDSDEDYNRPNSGDYNKRNSGDYNKRNSGDYNKRNSGDSIRKSGGYDDVTYDRSHGDKESILDKAHDRMDSMVDDVKDDYNHVRNSHDNASYRDDYD